MAQGTPVQIPSAAHKALDRFVAALDARWGALTRGREVDVRASPRAEVLLYFFTQRARSEDAGGAVQAEARPANVAGEVATTVSSGDATTETVTSFSST